jgi:hypothetical protein
MTRRIFCKLVFVVVGIFGLLVLPGLLSAQGRSEEALEWVKYIQEKHTDALMARPGVVGTAVGLGQGARPIVLVLLEYGGVPGIPQELEGVAVRPVVTGKIYALKPPTGKPDKPGKPPKESVDPTARFDRPVPIGVSTGHPAITAGTIGCRVTKGGEVYALSNNHVYADENAAGIGDPVIQPGTYDGGKDPAEDDADVIGWLDDFEVIVFSTSAANVIDAAIASTTESLVGNATPSDGYGAPKSTTVAAQINQAVKKYGRTTGLTKGRVYAINATVDVEYDSGVARFVEQIVITPGGFSAPGDSGSLIVVDGKGRDRGDDRKPVGLLFAGSDLYTVANPIDAVLTALGVSIDGE